MSQPNRPGLWNQGALWWSVLWHPFLSIHHPTALPTSPLQLVFSLPQATPDVFPAPHIQCKTSTAIVLPSGQPSEAAKPRHILPPPSHDNLPNRNPILYIYTVARGEGYLEFAVREMQVWIQSLLLTGKLGSHKSSFCLYFLICKMGAIICLAADRGFFYYFWGVCVWVSIFKLSFPVSRALVCIFDLMPGEHLVTSA